MFVAYVNGVEHAAVFGKNEDQIILVEDIQGEDSIMERAKSRRIVNRFAR
jgi:hypothetical protein